jgi:hypothetical protein
VDPVSVYDDYPAMVLVHLEDLGFAGDSVKELIDLRLADRRLPVNTWPTVPRAGGRRGRAAWRR